MALINALGPFVFLDLRGGVEVVKQEVELLRRPGVPGVGLKQTGVRGAPFHLQSRSDAFNLADAKNTYENYTQYVGDGVPRGLIQYNNNFADDGLGFLILDVKPLALRQMLFFQGGLFPPSLGWVEADWTLVCVQLGQQGGDE